MSEIIYIHPKTQPQTEVAHAYLIRWLEEATDYALFNTHLILCGQEEIDKITWHQIYKEGTVYCGLFIDQHMVARACVEKYSTDYWEVADVRVVKTYRNMGHAKAVCQYVLDFILAHHKQATIRTEVTNYSMQNVIHSVGFVKQ